MTSQQPVASDAELKDRLSRSVISAVGSKVLYLGSRFLLPPLILAHVTLPEYGLWATCFILIGYLGMGSFGVSHVYIRYVATYAAERDYDAISRLVSTGLVIMSVLNGLLFAGVWLLLPQVLDLLHVAPELRELARVLVLFTTAAFLLDSSLGVFNSVLEGLHRVPTTNLIWTVSFLLEGVLIFGLLQAGLGIHALLWAFVGRYLFSVAASMIACRRALPQLRIRVSHADRGMLRLFYGYGGVLQVSGLLAMVLRSAEKVLAGALIGVHATALYDVGEKLPMMAAWIPTGVGAGFLPATSHLAAQKRTDEIRKLYLKGCRYMCILTGLIVGFMAPFAQPIITGWLGPGAEYQTAALILCFFTLPYHMHVVTGPASIIYKGIGQPVRELFYPLTQLAFVAVTVTVGLLTAGATVMMINVAVSTSMVASALLYMAYTNRRLGVRQGEFVVRVLLPGLIPYGLALLLALGGQAVWPHAADDRLRALALVGVAGAIYALTTPLVLHRFCFDAGERDFLRTQIAKAVESLMPRTVRLARALSWGRA